MFRQKEDSVYESNSQQLLASPEGILVSGTLGGPSPDPEG